MTFEFFDVKEIVKGVIRVLALMSKFPGYGMRRRADAALVMVSIYSLAWLP